MWAVYKYLIKLINKLTLKRCLYCVVAIYITIKWPCAVCVGKKGSSHDETVMLLSSKIVMLHLMTLLHFLDLDFCQTFRQNDMTWHDMHSIIVCQKYNYLIKIKYFILGAISCCSSTHYHFPFKVPILTFPHKMILGYFQKKNAINMHISFLIF